MRVVLVCPYSLSLPGGVQGQVLGLARTLRQRGISATVLGPCDGPPPEPGVISVGSSVSLAANGSVAALALDPSAIRRTLEVLAAEEPDVLHLHEPLVPGPALTALLAGNVPAVGTFHASGRVPAYVWLRPAVRAVARRIGLRTAVSPEARALAERWLGGACHVLPNGVEVERFAKADPVAGPERRRAAAGGPSSSSAATNPARVSMCCWRRSAASTATPSCGWRAKGPTPAPWPHRPRPGWSGWAASPTTNWPSGCGRRRCSAPPPSTASRSASSFSRPWLPARPSSPPTSPATATSPAHDKEAVLVPGGDPAALADGLRRVLDDPTLAGRLVEAGTARAASFSMDRLAARYARPLREPPGENPIARPKAGQ